MCSPREFWVIRSMPPETQGKTEMKCITLTLPPICNRSFSLDLFWPYSGSIFLGLSNFPTFSNSLFILLFFCFLQFNPHLLHKVLFLPERRCACKHQWVCRWHPVSKQYPALKRGIPVNVGDRDYLHLWIWWLNQKKKICFFTLQANKINTSDIVDQWHTHILIYVLFRNPHKAGLSSMCPCSYTLKYGISKYGIIATPTFTCIWNQSHNHNSIYGFYTIPTCLHMN